jgi:hypothetical protein
VNGVVFFLLHLVSNDVKLHTSFFLLHLLSNDIQLHTSFQTKLKPIENSEYMNIMILPFDYMGYKRLSENKRFSNHRWYSDATWGGNG